MAGSKKHRSRGQLDIFGTWMAAACFGRFSFSLHIYLIVPNAGEEGGCNDTEQYHECAIECELATKRFLGKVHICSGNVCLSDIKQGTLKPGNCGLFNLVKENRLHDTPEYLFRVRGHEAHCVGASHRTKYDVRTLRPTQISCSTTPP